MTTLNEDMYERRKFASALVRWHDSARDLVTVLCERHGPPDEALPSALSWNARGPWKRIRLLREPVEHRWPIPHFDVVEHTIEHHVPVARVAEIVSFHGGIAVHRTRGELSVCCSSEEINTCALNLAHEMAESRLSAPMARIAFARRFGRAVLDVDDPYLSGLMFGRQVNTRDPDEPFEGDLALRSYIRKTPPDAHGRDPRGFSSPR